MSKVGKLIEDKRLSLKMSKEEMAERLDISGQLLGLYITGKRNPKVDFYIRWKAVFKEDLLQTNVSREKNTLVNDDEDQRLTEEPNSVIKEFNKSDFSKVISMLEESHRVIIKNADTILNHSETMKNHSATIRSQEKQISQFNKKVLKKPDKLEQPKNAFTPLKISKPAKEK